MNFVFRNTESAVSIYIVLLNEILMIRLICAAADVQADFHFLRYAHAF